MSTVPHPSLFDHLDVGAFVYDPDDGGILAGNEQFRRHLNYEEGELSELGVEDVTVEGWLPPTTPTEFAEQADPGDSITNEWRYSPADAPPFSAATTLSLAEQDGDTFVVATVRAGNGQIDARANQLAALFENIPEPAIRYAFEGGDPIIKAVNDAFEEVFGFDRADVLGESIDNYIVPPEDVDHARDLNTKVRNGELLDAEVQRRTADGVKTFLIRNAPIETDNGTHGYAIYTDIDERKQKEEELEQLTEQLELLNRVVRHDIGNDMTVILGMADHLKDHVDEKGRKHLDRLVEKGDHVVNITNVIRDYMKILLEDGSELEAIRLWPVLEAEVDDVRASYSDAIVQVETPPTNVRVVANEMLESVFRNLLKNAVQHNDKDVPEVTVSLTEDDETVRVDIADNGPGIPDSQKEVVFGRGEQGLDSRGTGLGLHLVDTIVTQFDGEVWIDDNDPEGSVFHVELPKA